MFASASRLDAGAPFRVVAALAVLAGAGAACQNADLLRPPEPDPAARTFTPIGEEPRGPLTSDVAMRRLDAIRAAEGAHRLELVGAFMEEFREARLIPQVYRLAGEAHLATGAAAEAADAFERSLVLTRSDILGIPRETTQPLQLAMARLSAGQVDQGVEWLVRTSIADRGPNVMQALRWAHAEYAAEERFDRWLARNLEPLLTPAPTFDLPGLQQDRMSLVERRGKATVINFWSPT